VKALIPACAASLVLLAGCAATHRPQGEPGAGMIGAPNPDFDRTVVRGAGLDASKAEGAAIRMPDRITLPATYRLVLLDGHLALVRETDAQAMEPGPTSLRIVMGEVARGEIAYQPALLPQELASEVASSRESSARMDNALEGVMRRSRELSEQARELEAQGKTLAELLAAAQARERELEAASPQSPGRAATAKPDPKGPPE
jgi:hypothetical protein